MDGVVSPPPFNIRGQSKTTVDHFGCPSGQSTDVGQWLLRSPVVSIMSIAHWSVECFGRTVIHQSISRYHRMSSICPSVHQSLSPSICTLWSVRQATLSVLQRILPSMRLSVHTSVRPHDFLCTRLSVRVSVCPSVLLSVCPSVLLSVCLSFSIVVRFLLLVRPRTLSLSRVSVFPSVSFCASFCQRLSAGFVHLSVLHAAARRPTSFHPFPFVRSHIRRRPLNCALVRFSIRLSNIL